MEFIPAELTLRSCTVDTTCNRTSVVVQSGSSPVACCSNFLERTRRFACRWTTVWQHALPVGSVSGPQVGGQHGVRIHGAFYSDETVPADDTCGPSQGLCSRRRASSDPAWWNTARRPTAVPGSLQEEGRVRVLRLCVDPTLWYES